MFFRIWFLYLSKLAIVLFAALACARIFPQLPMAETVGRICLWLLVPLCVAGGILGLWFAIISNRIRCPLCGEAGQLVLCGRNQPGVRCRRCGLVYAKHVLFSLQLCREPLDEPAAIPAQHE